MSKSLCCIEKCLTKSSSIKVKDIIYYLFPLDTDWASEWVKKIKEFDPTFKRKSDDKICSLHFAKSSMQPITRQLVDHAVPIYFPMNKFNNSQTSKSSAEPSGATASKGSCCCVSGCTTKFSPDSKIHGFSFPKTENRRRLWLYFLELHNSQKLEWCPPMKICALHFPLGDFTPSGKLEETAKPTIFSVDGIKRRRNEIHNERSKPIQAPAKPISNNGVEQAQPKIAVRRNLETIPVIQKCSPINARRLSLPYMQLPTKSRLIRMRRLPNETESVALSCPRLIAPKATLQTKAVLRPIPALNSLVHRYSDGQQNISAQQSTPILRKVVATSTKKQISTNNVQMIGAPNRKIVTVHMNDGSKTQMKQSVDTLQSSAPNMKTYSRQSISIEKGQRLSAPPKIAGPSMSGIPQRANTSARSDRLTTDILIIDENDLAKTKPTLGLVQLGDTDGPTDKLNISIVKKLGERRHYVIKSEEALRFPRVLSNRIQRNRQRNAALYAEVFALKKKFCQLSKAIRLQNVTNISETIEIS